MVLFNNGCSKVDLVTTHAKDLAQKTATKDENTKTYVRRFYQEYVSCLSGIDKDNFTDEVLLRIKMLIPKAEYTKAKRDFKNDSNLFIDWFIKNLEQIKNFDNAKDYMTYFEAYIGYFYSAQQ